MNNKYFGNDLVFFFLYNRPKLLMALKEHREVKEKDKACHKENISFVSPYAKTGSSQRNVSYEVKFSLIKLLN